MNFKYAEVKQMNKNERHLNLNVQSFIPADTTIITEGHRLISSSDCFGCHALYREVTAPSYLDISAKYKNDPSAVAKLTNKIISGGKGVWGTEREMNPHPSLLREDVEKMVQFILSLNKNKNLQKTRP